MANSYENTILPENPVGQIKPDAIPVDDKGQPLPDPTESLSSYIAPKGVEELKKTYAEVEVDEDVRKTMEPPQKTGIIRKHRPGKRGYDYYGTPAGSVPNDSNGLKPSPLSKLFSEAEALETDFDLDEIRNHVLQHEHKENGEVKVVETPKLDISAIKNADKADKKSDDELLKKPEVVKDPNAPKFLDMYKESTNTKVVYQSDEQENESVKPLRTVEETQQLFAEHSQVTKAKKRISRREEKKALKAAIKAEKKAAKERRKAEKAARKAAKKAARDGKVSEEAPAITAPDDITVNEDENAAKAEEERIRNAIAETVKEEISKKAEEAVEAAKAEGERLAAEKEEAEKQLEILNRQKEEAELEAQHAAQEAEKRIKKEKEALRKQKKETKAAQKEKEEAILKLGEEKAAAKKAEKEAESARREVEKLKSELEEMRAAAARAIAQKNEAEEAARIAREGKAQFNGEISSEKGTYAPAEQKNEESEKAPDYESEEKPIIKAVMEKYMSENKSSEQKTDEENDRKHKNNDNGDIYIGSQSNEVIQRRIEEIESGSSPKSSK